MGIPLERRHADRLEECAEQHPFLADPGDGPGADGVRALRHLPHPAQRRPAGPGQGGRRPHGRGLPRPAQAPRVSAYVVTIATGCTGAAVASGYPLTPLLPGPVMAALYWLATLTDRGTTRAYGVVTMVAVIVGAVFTDSMDHLSLLVRDAR